MRTHSLLLITIGGLITLFVFALSFRKPPAHAPVETPRPSAPISAATPPPEGSPGLQFETIRVPQITLEEFTAPNLVSARPAHKDIVQLRDIKEVAVSFGMPLEAPSKLIVLVGNKPAGSTDTPASDSKTLRASLATGAFDIANLPRGVYEVYYTACFPGEGCFNGQYAFVGL